MAAVIGIKPRTIATSIHYENLGSNVNVPADFRRRMSVTQAIAVANVAHGSLGSNRSPQRDSLPRGTLLWDVMNNYTLAFFNDDMEASFLAFTSELYAKSWRRTWIVILLLCLLELFRILLCNSLGFQPDSMHITFALIIWGLGVVFPFVFVAVLTYPGMRFFSAMQPHFQVIFSLLTMITTTCACIALGDQLDEFFSGVQAATYGLFYTFLFMTLRIRYMFSIICVVPFVIIFTVYTAIAPELDTYIQILSIVYVFVQSIVCLFLCYEKEVSLRDQFLHSSFLLRNNAKLRDQLNTLKVKYTTNGADFDSPLEKVNSLMNALLSDQSLGPEQLRIVSSALQLINSTNVLQPDLEVQINEGQVTIDRDTEAWLFTELAQRERALTSINSIKPKRNPSNMNFDFNPTDAILEGLELSADEAKRAHALLKESEGNFNFDIFELDTVTHGHVLSVLSLHYFIAYGVVSTFALPLDQLRNFLRKIEAGYRQNPYHSSTHAADVLHATNYFLHNTIIKASATDIDRLIAFVAAIIHDFDHPGLSNVFQVNAATTKAIVYNDRSVLENHHLAASFLVLENPDCNFLSHLPKAKFKQVRQGVIEMVLATDLAQHFKILSQFKAKLQADFDIEKSDDKLLLHMVMLKCADVSNGAKNPTLYHKWTDLIMEEFYRQGEEEKKLGLPISPFMDREQPKLAQCQKGFLEFICLPLYEAFHSYVNVPTIFKQSQENAAYWAAQIEASPSMTTLSGSAPISPASALPPPSPNTQTQKDEKGDS